LLLPRGATHSGAGAEGGLVGWCVGWEIVAVAGPGDERLPAGLRVNGGGVGKSGGRGDGAEEGMRDGAGDALESAAIWFYVRVGGEAFGSGAVACVSGLNSIPFNEA